MRTGTRFHVFYEGEDQEVGFMQGLDDFDCDEERQDELLANFNQHLPVPDIYAKRAEGKQYWASFFTEKGMAFFKEDIDRLIHYWEDRLSCDIATESFNGDGKILYEDEYQFVVKQVYKT